MRRALTFEAPEELKPGTYPVYEVWDGDRVVAYILDAGIGGDNAQGRIAAAGALLRGDSGRQGQGQGVLSQGGQDAPARGEDESPAEVEGLAPPPDRPRPSSAVATWQKMWAVIALFLLIFAFTVAVTIATGGLR
jgi:hypothetical protein